MIRALKTSTFLLLLLACRTGLWGQAQPAGQGGGLDAESRDQILDNILRELRERYVLPASVPQIEKELRTRSRSGAYDGALTPAKLAETLTEDLRKASGDWHMAVTHDPAKEARLLAAKAATGTIPQDLDPTPEEIEAARRNNFGFEKVERLAGNVVVLDVRAFVDLTLSRETAASALGFLASADAVILDLRQNAGGYINAEDFLMSHFFGPRPVELFSIYDRATNRTTRKFTLADIPGKRLERTDLFVLTSGRTASAGEAVALTLQRLGRATVVGERTIGAGHGYTEVPAGHGFVLAVPIFYQLDPRTGKGWEGIGVQPDLAVPADRALDIAHLEAVKRLAAKAPKADRRRQLGWLVPLLELKASGPKQVSPSWLQRYAGTYEGIEILLEQGRLYFLGASGIRRNLLAYSDSEFLIEDASVLPENQARVRFVADAQGAITELQLLVEVGALRRKPFSAPVLDVR
jgi:retinol-binding protein 3